MRREKAQRSRTGCCRRPSLAVVQALVQALQRRSCAARVCGMDECAMARAMCRGQGLTWRCTQPPGSSIGHLVYTPTNGSCKVGSVHARDASWAKASAWPGVRWGFRQLILEARRGGSGLRRARAAGATWEWIYSTQTCSSLEQFACVPGEVGAYASRPRRRDDSAGSIPVSRE